MKISAVISVSLAWLFATSVALSEPSAVSPAGFLVTQRHEVHASPQQVFDAIGRVGQWWNDAHTFSGHAANLSLNLASGGCFCEQWDGNSVQHAQVIQVRRGSLVRMQGGIGPLQPLPVNAVLTFAVATVGDKTQLTVTYAVAGNSDAALDKLASAVDSVIGDATDRLVAYVEATKP